MAKVQKLSELSQSISFTEYDFYEHYLQTFENTVLGKMKKLLPLREMAENFGLVSKRRSPKRGPKPYFTPEEKVALAFLKMYTQTSAPKLMEQLNVLYTPAAISNNSPALCRHFYWEKCYFCKHFRVETMNNIRNQADTLRHDWKKRVLTVIVTAISGFLLLMGLSGSQPTLSCALPLSSLPGHGKIAADTIDPAKYFLTFYDDSPERKAYAKELVNFVERLQHDEATFDADLSAKLDELRITLLTSPDGKLKFYSWEDGDNGSTIGFHALYQTRSNGEFHAVFMEDYYREPRKLYQLESSDGPIYIVEYFFRESGWSYDIGADAFSIDKSGLLQPAKVFECIPEIQKETEGYSANLALECTPEPPSLYYESAWEENFFFEQTGKDLYMPQFAYLRGPNGGLFMTDYYHRFTWDGNKFRYKQSEFNPVLTKYLPEPGWLLSEFEKDDSVVRVDSVADGSYRLILWKKDGMFSSAPEMIITQGRYDAAKREYHFGKGDEEYVFNTVSQQLQVLYTDPETKKVEMNPFKF